MILSFMSVKKKKAFLCCSLSAVSITAGGEVCVGKSLPICDIIASYVVAKISDGTNPVMKDGFDAFLGSAHTREEGTRLLDPSRPPAAPPLSCLFPPLHKSASRRCFIESVCVCVCWEEGERVNTTH